MNPLFIWLAILAVSIIIELATAQLLTVWFMAGSVAAMLMVCLGQPMWVQITAFVVVSAIILVIIYPILKKAFSNKHEKTNLDATIGRTAIVTEEINNILGTGRVIESGVYWTAKSSNDSIIKEGSTVTIKEISGAKLIVEEIKNNK